MAKKEPPAEEGAPAWMLTYGDMITLVLCFFVLLFSMSEIKKDKISKTMRAFQKQFGVLPAYKTTVQVFIEARRMTQTASNVLRRGPLGKHLNVQVVDQGKKMKIIIGGKTLFKENDYNLLPEGQQMLKTDVSPDLKGYENKIEIRGHTASSSYGKGSQWADSWELGYRRALTVMRYLVDECGIEERRCRVVSCGDSEPRSTNLTEEGRVKNRRVEIVMTEEFVTDRDDRKQPVR
jgi:chemotaxis protein MotB